MILSARSLLSALAATLTLLTVATRAASGQGTPSFRAAYPPVSNPRYAGLQAAMRRDRELESLAETLNGVFRLPTPLTLAFRECGAVNAYYNPSDHSLNMCYELWDDFGQRFGGGPDSATVVDDNMTFSFSHEMGHALIDMLNLPATGNEEDVADQLATIILVGMGNAGEDAALHAAQWFLSLSQTDRLTPTRFADEHALSAQRFFNVVCWVYGKNPGRDYWVPAKGVLPESRLAKCPGQYARMRYAWERQLAPYVVSSGPAGIAAAGPPPRQPSVNEPATAPVPRRTPPLPVPTPVTPRAPSNPGGPLTPAGRGLPILIGFHPAGDGRSKTARVSSLADGPLNLMVDVPSAGMSGQTLSFRMSLPARQSLDIGVQRPWLFTPGKQFTVRADGFLSRTYRVP